jgi:regulator of nucleoside diphosphate kinase
LLAPVGAALLGLRGGQSIDWPLPANRAAGLRIISVLYQPDSSGDREL